MKTRKLGLTGPEVSAIGLGCMGMSAFYGGSDEVQSIAVIHRALNLGVTLFDTAEMYADAEAAASLAESRTVLWLWYSATVILRHASPARLEAMARKVVKAMADCGFESRIEDTNTVECWLGSMPGNPTPNLRRPLIHSQNLADFLPLSGVWTGLDRNPCPLYPPNSPPLLHAATVQGIPFRFNLHVGDVPHCLIMGPTGRGKSTLLYVLGLMLTPTSGVVRLGDVDASTRPDRERSRLRATSVGFVFQDSELDPSRPILDSVVEPGLYAGLERQTLEDRARALLERFGLAHRADHRPGQVSGGQAQRVAVCRALVNVPVVVLADEPTGNLDPDNAGLVMDALADAAAEGRTVVVATHDPAVVARADEVVRL